MFVAQTTEHLPVCAFSESRIFWLNFSHRFPWFRTFQSVLIPLLSRAVSFSVREIFLLRRPLLVSACRTYVGSSQISFLAMSHPSGPRLWRVCLRLVQPLVPHTFVECPPGVLSACAASASVPIFCLDRVPLPVVSVPCITSFCSAAVICGDIPRDHAGPFVPRGHGYVPIHVWAFHTPIQFQFQHF